MSTPGDSLINAFQSGYGIGQQMLQARRQNAMRQILSQAYQPPQTQTQQVPQTDAQGNPVVSYAADFRGSGLPIASQNITTTTPGGFDWQKAYQLAGPAGVAPEVMMMQSQSPELAFQKMMAEYQLKNWMQNQQINNTMSLMQKLMGQNPEGQNGGGFNPYGPAALSVGMGPNGPQFTFDPSKAIGAEGQLARGNAALTEANWNTGSNLPMIGMPGQPMRSPPTNYPIPSGPAPSSGMRPSGMSPKDWSESQKTTRIQRVTTDYANVDKMGSELTDKAMASADTYRITSMMRDLLTQFTPGKFNDVKSGLAAYAQATGHPEIGKAMTGLDPTQTGAIQAFNKLTAQLVTKQIKETGSRVMQVEFNTFLKNNPNAELTPQGMATMLGYLDKTSQDNIDNLRYFNQWRKENPTGTTTDFSTWNTQRLMNQNKPQLVGEDGKPLPTAVNPKTGQRIVLKDGQWQPIK